MTMEIEELTEDELIQLKHYWCIQTDRRDSKCILDGKVVWEGKSCNGCPYEIKNKTMAIGDIAYIQKHDGGHWKGEITTIDDMHADVAIVNELNGVGHAAIIGSKMNLINGEWWDVRL
jgi:hypothetical protein